MGLYIKDLGLPEGCGAITLKVWGDGLVEIIDEDGEWKETKAIPVPPHGRLIDADEFCTEHRSLKLLGRVGIRRFNWHVAAAAFVEDAPTIIPASEEETE